MPRIQEWNDIKVNFQDGLLVGNGASIAVHPGFAYKSLYSEARRIGHIAGRVVQIFENFETDDFELVLRRLWQATLVNKALGIERGKVEESYEHVRQALIATVRATHVSHADAGHHLVPIYQFMQNFKTVISLNYDLIVYWAAMLGNGTLGPWFKDAFESGYFGNDWTRKRGPWGKAKGSTLYFYPHGNLVLARAPSEVTRKLKVSPYSDLLEEILSKWESGSAVPVFVCEGTSEHKRPAIESDPYLQRVFREVIPAMGNSLVIYGWSLSEQDQHILDQLKCGELKRVAVSVRDNNQKYAQLAAEKLSKIAANLEVVFFYSASPGSWNNLANSAAIA